MAEIATRLDEEIRRTLWWGLRMIDLRLDVAFGMLLGIVLILLGIATRWRSRLGLWLAIPSVAFGIALIVLNLATFP